MIRFTNDLLNAIIDKFGVDVTMFPEDDGHSIIIADVLASEGFLYLEYFNLMARFSY